jgi:hypothetical protein
MDSRGLLDAVRARVGSGPAHVLVVEDDADIRPALIRVFEMEGFTVAGVVHGADGLAQARERRPDLVLLDMMMPVMAQAADDIRSRGFVPTSAPARLRYEGGIADLGELGGRRPRPLPTRGEPVAPWYGGSARTQARDMRTTETLLWEPRPAAGSRQRSSARSNPLRRAVARDQQKHGPERLTDKRSGPPRTHPLIAVTAPRERASSCWH